ncbi:MAG: 4-alpha-glucanotransferase [Gemmatimonadetes bacterium]|nr:4-alpha-glucanotransferase [Gemmatimonadota bacterium]
MDLPRSSGVLLHVSSLPGPQIGDLGDAAHRWVDWLADAGQSMWQILPLVPVNEGGSPYNGLSALAGNPLLVSPARLVDDGLLDASELRGAEGSRPEVDFARVMAWKDHLLHRAFTRFRSGAAPEIRTALQVFRARSGGWIEEYALFRALRDAHGGASWTTWERPIRLRESAAVQVWRERLSEQVEEHVFREFLFERQWAALHEHARTRGVRIVGDIPIFVAHDSADVWANRELFYLDEEGQPTVVAGVPPDYFSKTGQRWGNPLYRWDVMQERGYRWWTERFRRIFEQVDIARIDHFRGFEAYWEISAEEETAMNGCWVSGPGAALFHAVERELGPLPLIAEDLGLITAEVDELRDDLGLPGMRVLQFAFDGDPSNPHLPANYPRNSVCYTGTHDNATVLGWWRDLDLAEREQVRRLIDPREAEVHWDLIRVAFQSTADWALAPLQDVLGLGDKARMNTPGTAEGNWAWRMPENALTDDVQTRLLEITRSSSRLRACGSTPPHP